MVKMASMPAEPDSEPAPDGQKGICSQAECLQEGVTFNVTWMDEEGSSSSAEGQSSSSSRKHKGRGSEP